VRDDGPGVPHDILSRIFDPFFTTKPEMSGVGLGLSIAEGLVRSAGGRLTVEQRADGHGASFVVSLPRVPDPGPASTPATAGVERTTQDGQPHRAPTGQPSGVA